MDNFKDIYLPDLTAYYINLDRDVEKSENVEKTLNDLGFKSVKRFAGIEEEIKKIGVAKSHNLLLKKLSKEKAPFIVFEDDILPSRFDPHLKVPKNADAYYLGSSSYGLYSGVGRRKISLELYEDKTYRIYNMLAAHAILYLNTDYVKFLAKATEFSVYIRDNQDKARAETMKYWNVYAGERPMFYQSGTHGPATRVGITNTMSVGPERAYGR